MILPQIYGQLFCMLHIMNLYNLIHIISILFLDIFLLLEPNMAYDNGGVLKNIFLIIRIVVSLIKKLLGKIKQTN